MLKINVKKNQILLFQKKKKKNTILELEASIPKKRYLKLELIDSGSYGKVYKGIDNTDDKIVAIKYI